MSSVEKSPKDEEFNDDVEKDQRKKAGAETGMTDSLFSFEQRTMLLVFTCILIIYTLLIAATTEIHSMFSKVVPLVLGIVIYFAHRFVHHYLYLYIATIWCCFIIYDVEIFDRHESQHKEYLLFYFFHILLNVPAEILFIVIYFRAFANGFNEPEEFK